MIIAVGGVIPAQYNTEHKNQYKQEYYQPHSQAELKQNIDKDFGKMLSAEISKLNVDILI